ncbi:MAG: hypothetical protein C5B59_02605 [Bacteroidetes bacterium]|nr:MAG: hypothetical protein C5B59_02605 [Bacteroidota bacterium]
MFMRETFSFCQLSFGLKIVIYYIKKSMNNRGKGILYMVLGIYALMVSWYYNHSIVLLIIHYIFWPIYLIYELLSGRLSNDMWRKIPESYFR